MPTASRPLRLVPIALVPGTIFAAVFVWRSGSSSLGERRYTLFDDAMISMTYARTWADTGELVWFPGASRVQGITNPLWTAFMGAIHAVGLKDSAAALAISLVGVATLICCAVLVSVIVRRALDGAAHADLMSAAAAGTTLLLYPLVFWTVRGMEVGVLALMLLLLLWAAPWSAKRVVAPRHIAVMSLAGSVGVATRLDFSVLALAIIVWSAATRPTRREQFVFVSVVGGAVLLTMAAVLAWQRLYFGEWLPNTYQLKVGGYSSGDRLLRGLVSFGKVMPLALMLAIAAHLVRAEGSESERRLSAMATSGAGAGLAYSVWVGGDAWESFLMFSRYVSVVLPAIVIVVFLALSRIRAAGGAGASRLAIAAIPLSGLCAGFVSNPYRFHAGYALGTVALLLVIMFASARVGRGEPHDRRSSARHAVLASLLLVSATGAYPMVRWVSDGGLHVRDDQFKTQEAMAIESVTETEAVLAVTWAGALAYHSHRPMIDLLGKSDERIARTVPIGSFYPGHNKYDYAYSIGELRPDVVGKTWRASDPVNAQLVEWGYVLRCFDLDGARFRAHFRSESSLVRWDAVSECN